MYSHQDFYDYTDLKSEARKIRATQSFTWKTNTMLGNKEEYLGLFLPSPPPS